jgi:hypothetical protein
MGELPVMQRKHERGRQTVAGRRTDDGAMCTLLVVEEIGGTFALYPHGAAQLGVRITNAAAVTLGTLLTGNAG